MIVTAYMYNYKQEEKMHEVQVKAEEIVNNKILDVIYPIRKQNNPDKNVPNV